MAAAVGSKPTYFHVPPGSRFTIAEEVADFMSDIGYMVDDAERTALKALLPQKRNGDWVGLETCIVAPRQNLKTATMLGMALHDTFVQGVERVVWTAHEFKTSSDAFRDLRAIIEGTPYLDAAVLKIRTANGKEGFELRNGSRLDILARTGRSGRGMGGDRLYADEALFLEGKMMGALVPTMSARRNAHIVYGSSPGVMESSVLRSLRDRGRSGTDKQLGYVEWTSDRKDCEDINCTHEWNAVGCQLDDETLWEQSNPALGRRISYEFVRQERRALPPVEFMRERMGWWEDPPEDGTGTVFPLESWRRCGDDRSGIADDAPISLAVDVSWDRSMAYVVAFGANAYGIPHGQLVHHGSPSDVVAYIADLCSRRPIRGVAVQASSAPASSLVPDLERDVPVPVFAMQSTDLQRACGMAFDRISAEQVRHSAQPLVDRAVAVAEARPLSDGWVLDRKRSRLDIAGLVAWVNALWLHQTFEEEVVASPFVIY